MFTKLGNVSFFSQVPLLDHHHYLFSATPLFARFFMAVWTLTLGHIFGVSGEGLFISLRALMVFVPRVLIIPMVFVSGPMTGTGFHEAGFIHFATTLLAPSGVLDMKNYLANADRYSRTQ